jgi:hypothetical protein
MIDRLWRSYTVWENLEYVRIWRDGDVFTVEHVFGNEEPKIIGKFDISAEAEFQADVYYEELVDWYENNLYDPEVSV